MMWGYYDHRMHDGWAPGTWLFMFVVMAVFLVLLAAVVYLLLRPSGRTSQPAAEGRVSHQPSMHTAEQLLAERFARGELDEEEYRHRREVLGL